MSVSVLFVCLGNICRSPMADGVFQNMVKEAGLEAKILVDSAGTSNYHSGSSAHGGTLQVLSKHNIDYGGRSRPLDRTDYHQYDYILAMDNSNMDNIMSRKPDDSTATIKMFLDYAKNTDETEVPDPYYGGGFDYVYELIEDGCLGLLNAIREEHNL